MRQWHRIAVILAAATVGFLLGWTGSTAFHRTAPRQTPAMDPDQELRRQLFDAIYRMLAEAHLSPRDMPREILDIRPLGDRRYLVHMAMGEGEAWFEVYWDGTAWRARGLNVPPAP